MSALEKKQETSVVESPPSAFQLKSSTIGKLAEALAKAQSEIRNATKDKDNPFFKSTYADLASVWDACREPLSKNNLSVTQPIGLDPHGRVILTTLLLHSSGEWVASQIPLNPVKNDPQGMGSAITYMRRFCLSSIVGVAPSEKPTADDVDDSDDDGNAASGNVVTPKGAAASQVHSPQQQGVRQLHNERKPSEAQLKRLFAICGNAKLTHEQTKAIVYSRYGIESSKDLSLSQYNELCNGIIAGQIQPPKESNLVDDTTFPPFEETTMGEVSGAEPAGHSEQVPWAKYRDK